MDMDKIESRLQRLEAAVFGGIDVPKMYSRKPIALSQLSRSALLTNGQKKIALIVGYNEVILNQPPIRFSQIKEHWVKAKFAKSCDPKQLERAIIDGLVRDPNSSNEYDLTRDGEDFLQQVLKSFEDANNNAPAHSSVRRD
jgi:hypothetical protein